MHPAPHLSARLGEGGLDLVETDETGPLISWHDPDADPAGQVKLDPETFREAS